MARHSNQNNRRAAAVSDDFYKGSPSRAFPALHARQGFFFAIILLAALVFVLQLFNLTVLKAGEMNEEGINTRTSSPVYLAHRGTIYDRNGNVLATSVEVKSVYCDPLLVTDMQEQAECLVSVLGGDFNEYCELMSMENSRYVCIARKISLEDAEKLQAMYLDGFYFEDELERYYPYGEIGGQVIGCLDAEGKGLTGLEAYYDDVLAGENGYRTYQVGFQGAPIPGTITEDVPAVDGMDIVVSIDIEMQAYMEERLKLTQEQLTSKSAEAVMYDAETGEIFAAASLPLFNPADRSVVEPGADQLQIVTTAFEPGSVFKTVSALAVLEGGKLAMDDEIDCPSYLTADGFKVSDAHPRGDVTYSFEEILAYSSNVGISLAVQDYLGFKGFNEALERYHINEATGVDYPSESAGYLLDFNSWSRIQGYNVTFGQGVSVTPLQMVRFYGALNNNGVAMTPHFLLSIPQTGETANVESQTIIEDYEALSTINKMLVSVVENGTGKGSKIDGYTVAGKTSTAEIANPEGGYLDGVYNLAFCGYLPYSSSNLVCFVAANEVPWMADVTSAYKDIMSFAIERYKISPE